MKRFATLLLVVTLVSACSTNDGETQQATPPSSTASTEASPSNSAESDDGLGAIGDIEVNRGLFNVEITIPPEFVDAADQDNVLSQARDLGINNVTFNDDGSITYKMSRSQHRQWMANLGDDISQLLTALPASYPSIREVTHNRDFTRVTLTVDRNAWENGFDGFATLAIAFGAGFYQVFNGTSPDDIQINVDIVDVDTGEVFDTIVMPDALGD